MEEVVDKALRTGVFETHDALTGRTRSLLCSVAQLNGVKWLRLLVAAGAPLETRDWLFGRTALGCAVREGACECVDILLAAGADANTRDVDDELPVCHALQRRCPHCVRALMKAMRPEMRNYCIPKAIHFKYPMDWAIRSKSMVMMDHMLELGADPACAQMRDDDTYRHLLAMRDVCRTSIVVLYGIMRRRCGVCRDVARMIARMVWTLRLRHPWIRLIK